MSDRIINLADIQRDLPGWPEDVIEIWLLQLSRRADTGWPPPDPIKGHSWSYILGGKPIAWWINVEWKLQTVDCSFENLSKSTRRIVNDLCQAHVNDHQNIYSLIDSSSRNRFLRAVAFLAQRGECPLPIIGMQIASGLNILDGNHRIAAHAFLQKISNEQLIKLNIQRPRVTQQVWVGVHRDGAMLDG